jgi:hypothetical protein
MVNQVPIEMLKKMEKPQKEEILADDLFQDGAAY